MATNVLLTYFVGRVVNSIRSSSSGRHDHHDPFSRDRKKGRPRHTIQNPEQAGNRAIQSMSRANANCMNKQCET